MKGAIRIVAMRSRLFSMVRVAIMAGTAQPYAESSGMKLLPCKPTRAMVRSAISAARARYPESSRMPMKRNSSSTCGRKTSTLPTPRHAPSTMSEVSNDGGSVLQSICR